MQKKNGGEKIKAFFAKVWFVLKLTVKWGYQLRSFVLSIPVFVCAAALAIRNAQLLPEALNISIGENLYMAKVFFSTDELFAWTAMVILLSFLFEKGILWILKRGLTVRP